MIDDCQYPVSSEHKRGHEWETNGLRWIMILASDDGQISMIIILVPKSENNGSAVVSCTHIIRSYIVRRSKPQFAKRGVCSTVREIASDP